MTDQTQQPQFIQSLDVERPHSLLTKDTKFAGSLEYRYDDTGEVVSVPNIHYNQPFDQRAEAVRFDAQRADEQAESILKSAPVYITTERAAELSRLHRERAARIRAEADRMIAAGVKTHPVAAARMQLDYGPNVI